MESVAAPSASSKLLWVSASPVNQNPELHLIKWKDLQPNISFPLLRFTCTQANYQYVADIHNSLVELLWKTADPIEIILLGQILLPVSLLSDTSESSPCRFLMWTFLLPLWENIFPHMEHWWGFSPDNAKVMRVINWIGMLADYAMWVSCVVKSDLTWEVYVLLSIIMMPKGLSWW